MQHLSPEGAHNYETKGAMKKVSIAKLNWIVGAARVGAAHPTDPTSPRMARLLCIPQDCCAGGFEEG